MSLYELIEVVRRRWKLVAFLAGAMMIVGTLMVRSSDEVSYTASTRIIVDQPQLVPNVGGVNVAPKFATLAPTLCALLGSDESVASIAALVRPGGAGGDVGCNPVQGTTLLDIRSTGDDPERARALVDAGAAVLAEAIVERYAGAEVPAREVVAAEVLADARSRKDPDQTRRRSFLVVVGSLLAAAAFALAAEPHRRDARVAAHRDPSHIGVAPPG